MKERRYKAVTPVTDFSISQKIRVALIEDGHTALAVESICAPVRELEEDIETLRRRIMALERERVNWQTESGVHRLLDEREGKIAGDWGKWGIRLLIGAALTAAFAVLVRTLKGP